MQKGEQSQDPQAAYYLKRMQDTLNYIKFIDIDATNKEIIIEFSDTLRAEGLKPVRITKYLYTLKTITELLKTPFPDVTKKDAQRLITKIENHPKNYSEWTKRDFKIIFKRVMKYTREREGQEFDLKQYPKEVSWINTSQKKDRINKPKDLLTEDDVKKLADATQNLRDKAFILFLYESGARIGEIMNVRLKHIVFDKYGALIDLHGKTGDRRCRICASSPALANWISIHPEKGDREAFLFCGVGPQKRGKSLDSHTYRKLLRVTAGKVGIRKPINPHHFRHSRATVLAKKLTEAQLCQYMGWVVGSKEASTYVHLSGRDSDKAILHLYGLAPVDEEEATFVPIDCPRCGTRNDPTAKFCNGCSLGLDEKSILEYDERREQAAKLGFAFQEGAQESLLGMLQSLLDEQKKLKDELNQLKQS